MSECALTLPKTETRKIRPTLALLKQYHIFCLLNQKGLTKSPIESIRPALFAMANMPFGPVASSKRKLLLKEQSLVPSRICVFPVCNQTILFENAQNLESATSLIATALTMHSFTEPKEYTPQKTQQSHQLKEKPLRIPLIWKWKNLKILVPPPYSVLKVCFKLLN